MYRFVNSFVLYKNREYLNHMSRDYRFIRINFYATSLQQLNLYIHFKFLLFLHCEMFNNLETRYYGITDTLLRSCFSYNNFVWEQNQQKMVWSFINNSLGIGFTLTVATIINLNSFSLFRSNFLTSSWGIKFTQKWDYFEFLVLFMAAKILFSLER